MRPSVGSVGYRVAPGGSQPVYINRYLGDEVSVSTPGARSRWSIRPMTIPVGDLFATRNDARAEFRKRKGR